MAQATRSEKTRSPLAIHLAQGLKEAALWIFGVIAVLVFASLATYNPHDPSFLYSGDGGGVHNAIGPVGAWMAAGLYFLFGYPTYLFPFLLIWAGFMVFKARRSSEPVNKWHVVMRISGLILCLVTASGLASLNWGVAPGSLPVDAGGILGDFAGKGLAAGLSDLGATLLLLALFLAAVTIFTGLSWIAVMDRTGHVTLVAFERIRNRWGWLKEAVQTRRARDQQVEVIKVHTEQVRSRPKPRIEPVVKAAPPSPRVERERQVPLFEPPADSELPPLSILDDPPPKVDGYSEAALEAISRRVEIKLKDFGVDVQVVAVNPGPVVTRFEMQPAAGVKVSQISNLAKDLARELSAISVRVVEVIPGKSVVGLEIPNESRELVTLGEILRSSEYDASRSPLTLALGKDIGGNPVVADLERMPHLLIAGTTGSGKSVAINAMILSLLYKSNATKIIMIDPKMLELSVYEGIPHLLAPVVTDMKEAANALRWCVAEMEKRYRLMAAVGARNLAGYNRKIKDAIDAGKPIPDPLFKADMNELSDSEIPALQVLPNIVVVVDELADMMMVVGKKVEELIARLAQKARASGIHLILATQRPSVDVITGLIKANIPARIAFQVSARVDSRTILDQQGAESLLGHGDMLFLPPGTPVPMRIHGAFVSDQEVHRVVRQLIGSMKGKQPAYIDEILQGPAEALPGIPGLSGDFGGDSSSESDPLYDQAVRIVTETRRASISGVQRRLKIGYNRAARMIEEMEAAGIVGPLQSNGSREVLVAPPPPDREE